MYIVIKKMYTVIFLISSFWTNHFHALEREMATHSSVPAWRIPGMAEPDGLPSVGSHRVGHDWSDLAAAAVATQIQTQLFPPQVWTWDHLCTHVLSYKITKPCLPASKFHLSRLPYLQRSIRVVEIIRKC